MTVISTATTTTAAPMIHHRRDRHGFSGCGRGADRYGSYSGCGYGPFGCVAYYS
jgi:hypothetical protein